MSEISKFWKIINPVIPVCSIFLVLASSLEAAETQQPVSSKSYQHEQSTSLVYDRQDTILNTWYETFNKMASY